MQPREYSKRLGVLAPEQLQAALDRFGLGRLLGARPASGGLFGQNVLLDSTEGAFVLRGCPHYPWQFPRERFFARAIDQRTAVPAPWPYLIDESTGIFGWSYALMPRLPGRSFSDPEARRSLTAADQRGIARALGETRAALDMLTWDHPGEYNHDLDGIAPLETSFADWMIASVRDLLERSRQASAATTDADLAWTEAVIARSRPALAEPFQPAFAHRDFTGLNCVGERTDAGWRITGVFDLMEGYSGDPEADLSRSAAWYAITSPDALQAFIGAYTARRPPRPGFAERVPFYMLLDRLLIWEYGQRNGIWFEAGVSLRDWAERYTTIRVT